jgi:hypothetical protein
MEAINNKLPIIIAIGNHTYPAEGRAYRNPVVLGCRVGLAEGGELLSTLIEYERIATDDPETA